MAIDKKNELVDPKQESLSMFRQILCAPFVTATVPLHLSEPFNVDVEFGRISESLQDFELLDKNQVLIEKIKISNIIGVELQGQGGSSISLSSSTASGNTPPGSPQSTPRKESSKANSLLGINDSDMAGGASTPITVSKGSKASMILGLSGDEASSPKASSKASSILGLSDEITSPNSKKLGAATIHSPKFGLLARSASNNKLREKEKSLDSPVGSIGSSSSSTGAGGGSPSLSSSSGMGGMVGSPLSQSLGYTSGGHLLGSSPGTIGATGSISSGGGSPSSPLMPSLANIFPLHYNFIFTIQTSTTNYSFNARDKEASSQLIDALKLSALGKAYHFETQTSLDAITEALELANKCKSPPVPSLPLSPPPPPPHLIK